MIIHHTQLLNALIEKYNLKSYLEIGVQNPANNFDKVKADIKVGVDPEVDNNSIIKCSSDNFFIDQIEAIEDNTDFPFDLIFIDGLHTAEQVQRDFENSLRCLSDNGFIVIHDVLPDEEQYTTVPRQTKKWFGNVYQWAMNICKYDGIKYKTFSIDNGCMLIWKDATRQGATCYYPENFNTYLEWHIKAMNVTSTVEI